MARRRAGRGRAYFSWRVDSSWSEAWSFDLAIRRGYTDGVTEDELRGGLTWAFEAW
jgi:hypothetical protein